MPFLGWFWMRKCLSCNATASLMTAIRPEGLGPCRSQTTASSRVRLRAHRAARRVVYVRQVHPSRPSAIKRAPFERYSLHAAPALSRPSIIDCLGAMNFACGRVCALTRVSFDRPCR